MSEAQPFSTQGERRLKEGDLAGAKKVWQSLITVFADVDAEKPWVAKARQTLKDLEKEGKRTERWQAAKSALDKANHLADMGREEAETIWSAIETLYGRDTFAAELLAEVVKCGPGTRRGRDCGRARPAANVIIAALVAFHPPTPLLESMESWRRLMTLVAKDRNWRRAA